MDQNKKIKVCKVCGLEESKTTKFFKRKTCNKCHSKQTNERLKNVDYFINYNKTHYVKTGKRRGRPNKETPEPELENVE